MISYKCQLISWVILATMHFLHKTFPGTSDKIIHCAKFHSSSCLISWLSKSDSCETPEWSPPLYKKKCFGYDETNWHVFFVFLPNSLRIRPSFVCTVLLIPSIPPITKLANSLQYLPPGSSLFCSALLCNGANWVAEIGNSVILCTLFFSFNN